MLKRSIPLLLMALVWIMLAATPLLAQPSTSTPAPTTTSASTAAAPTATTTQVPAPAAAATLIPGYEYYTVQLGDTLYRISVRFRTTVRHLADVNGIVNPSLIFAGQRIQVPSVQQATAAPSGTAAPTNTPAPATPVPTATATLVPGSTTTYTVVAGDTLFRIAVRYNTTVARLQALNPSITNPNIIYVGQRLTVPAPGTASASTTTAPGATSAPSLAGGPAPAQTQEAGTTNEQPGTTTTTLGFGIETFFIGQDVAALTEQLTALGVDWVKVEVYWRDLEATQGQIDFATLDSTVDALEGAGLNILFTVTSAPAWARTSTEESGPPDDFATYRTFVGALADRYAGRVDAYEIWSEPNLRREWNSTEHTINAGGYMELLQIAYDAIKAQDSAAIVVSAGLAPTGYNDGVNAINDRLFLQGMYSNGLAQYSDAVGAHPNGWANPPDARCCNQPEGVASHYQDRSFFFLDTLSDYRDIMTRNGDGNTKIWVTQFGWGTTDDSEPLPENSSNVFLNYTSLEEQAVYITRAVELARELGYVGAMFLNNLNGCQGLPGDRETCYYSLIDANGNARPALDALEDGS